MFKKNLSGIFLLALFVMFGLVLAWQVYELNEKEDAKPTVRYDYGVEDIGAVVPTGVIKSEAGRIFMTVYKIEYEGKEYIYFERSGSTKAGMMLQRGPVGSVD